MVRVVLRALGSGRKISTLLAETVEEAYSVGTTLMQSSNYAKCFCEIVDADKKPLFRLQSAYAVPPPPQPARVTIDGVAVPCELMPSPLTTISGV